MLNQSRPKTRDGGCNSSSTTVPERAVRLRQETRIVWRCRHSRRWLCMGWFVPLHGQGRRGRYTVRDGMRQDFSIGLSRRAHQGAAPTQKASYGNKFYPRKRTTILETWLEPLRVLHGLARNKDQLLQVYPPGCRPSLFTKVDQAVHTKIKIEAGIRMVMSPSTR
ncbi:hypothetical protein EV421DRAFT_1441340 [Armillaria borealis]|uniref:Uncharacterized protein n=1 Tax=Armillaria borealis TaxID=47425 RepID=A0AA39MFT3_9AGAR|nr:hypothetical protein EV421DRAFT_1441340 [Armillaria borealis]